jgi:hypothetical protein
LTFFVVAWDVTANFSFGRHYGFLDKGKDVDDLITDSTAGLKYFAPVSYPGELGSIQIHTDTAYLAGLSNPLD